jgi:hypothetical protein
MKNLWTVLSPFELKQDLLLVKKKLNILCCTEKYTDIGGKVFKKEYLNNNPKQSKNCKSPTLSMYGRLNKQNIN